MHVSSSQLYAYLAELNILPSKDQIARLRPRLLGKVITLPHHDKERFYTVDDARRVYVYAVMCARLGVKKPHQNEVAFWLAAYGFEVPGDMVAAHVDGTMASFGRMLLRLLSRRANGTIPIHGANAEDLMRLGKLLAKAALRGLKMPFKPFTENALGKLVGLGLRAIFLNESFATVTLVIKQIIGFLPSRVQVTARSFWDEAQAFLVNLRPGTDNPIRRSLVAALAEDPKIVSTAACDVRRITSHAKTIIPIYGGAEEILAALPVLGPRGAQILERIMLPLLTGIEVHLRSHEINQEILAKLDSGELSPLDEFSRIRDNMVEFCHRIGIAL